MELIGNQLFSSTSALGQLLKKAQILKPKNAQQPTAPKFRANSFFIGTIESTVFKKTNRRFLQRLLLAAKRFDLKGRKKGERCGPLGTIALEVLEYFINIIDYKTGRLEPAISTIMGKIRRSRDSVVRALKALRDHGFLNWVRRYKQNDSDNGPALKQASNAYGLTMPQHCENLLSERKDQNTPICDHLDFEKSTRQQAQEEMFNELDLTTRIHQDFGENSRLAAGLLALSAAFSFKPKL